MVKGMTSRSAASRSLAAKSSSQPGPGTSSARSTRGPDFNSFHQLYEERREQLWQFLLLLAPRPGDVPPLYARTWCEFATKLCRHRRRPGDGFPSELYRIAGVNVAGAWRAIAPQRRSAGQLVVRDASGPDWECKVQQATLAALVEHNGLEAWQAARIAQVDGERARAMLDAARQQGEDDDSLAARVRGQSLQHAGSAPHKSLDARVLGQARALIAAVPPRAARETRTHRRASLRRVALVLLVVCVTGIALTWAALTVAGRPGIPTFRGSSSAGVGHGLSVAELFDAVDDAGHTGDYNLVAQLSEVLDLRLGHVARD